MSRPRSAFAAVVTVCLLALSACGGADSTSGLPRQATQPAESPSATTDEPTEEASAGHDGHHDAAPAKAKPLRAGESRDDDRDARQLHPVGPLRRRHRRLPVLPARPRAREGHLADRHARAARQPGRRAPRDPVPGPARTGRRGRGEGRGGGGRGLDVLRRHRPRPVHQRRRRSLDRRLGARWRGVGRQARLRRHAWPRARGSSCRSTTTCSPARQPDTSAAQLRLAPGKRPYQALHTMLLPGPVELPCRAKHDDGPLCDRDAATGRRQGALRLRGQHRRPPLLPVRWRAEAGPDPVVPAHRCRSR